MRNRTQFRRHAVPPEPGIQPPRQARRFITIHHISSQFRIHAGRRTGAPRNSAPSLEFKTKPAVRRGLEIGFGFQNARANRRRYRGEWEIGFGFEFVFYGHIAGGYDAFPYVVLEGVRGCARSNSGNLALLCLSV